MAKIKCDLCGESYGEGGDGYCGLCPSCADKTENELPYYCQDCEYKGIQEEFWPSDENPSPIVCPKCGRTNCFWTGEEP